MFYDFELPNDKLVLLREMLSAQADMENRIPITVSAIFDIPYVDKNTISIVDDKHKLKAMVNTTAVLDGYDPTYIGTTRLGTYVPELILGSKSSSWTSFKQISVMEGASPDFFIPRSTSAGALSPLDAQF